MLCECCCCFIGGVPVLISWYLHSCCVAQCRNYPVGYSCVVSDVLVEIEGMGMGAQQ